MSKDPGSELRLELLKGRVTLAVEGLKMLALVNGGAAVGILTYLGHLSSKGPGSVDPAGIRASLMAFSGGLVVCLLAFIVAYIAQGLAEEAVRADKLSDWPARLIIAGVVLALASAGLFAWGCYLGSYALIP